MALIEARRLSEWRRERDPVFASMTGTPLTPTNVHSRILNPAADAAGVPGIGFHAFRHTCASMLIDEGRSIVQVSRWLGHADPAFTLRVYAQLMDEGIGAPLDLKIATQSATRTSTDTPQSACDESTDLQAVSDYNHSTTLPRTTFNPKVVGSIPTGGIAKWLGSAGFGMPDSGP